MYFYLRFFQGALRCKSLKFQLKGRFQGGNSTFTLPWKKKGVMIWWWRNCDMGWIKQSEEFA
jgi:hypothetical protein